MMGRVPQSISIVVDFPAPLAPRYDNTSPFLTESNSFDSLGTIRIDVRNLTNFEECSLFFDFINGLHVTGVGHRLIESSDDICKTFSRENPIEWHAPSDEKIENRGSNHDPKTGGNIGEVFGVVDVREIKIRAGVVVEIGLCREDPKGESKRGSQKPQEH
jgi:hypothetical protein